MADTKISALTAASALDGTEVAPVVQSGTTKKATVDQYKTYINNGTALVDIQTNVNAAQALLASSGAAITAGQGYILDNGGVTQLPTGISLMRLVGINLPAGAKGFGYAEAYVTALATYFPCAYDVATNTISGEYIIYAAKLSQVGPGPVPDPEPTVDTELINLLGETPVFSYVDIGNYRMTITGSLFTSKMRDYQFLLPYGGTGDAFITPLSVMVRRVSDTIVEIYTGALVLDVSNDVLNNTYIEIKMNF